MLQPPRDPEARERYIAYAFGLPWGWRIREVEPVGEIVPVPSLVGGPTISYRCERARIVRRFTVSNAIRARALAAMGLGR